MAAPTEFSLSFLMVTSSQHMDFVSADISENKLHVSFFGKNTKPIAFQSRNKKFGILPFQISTSSSSVWYTGVADQTKKPPGRRTRFNSKRSRPPAWEAIQFSYGKLSNRDIRSDLRYWNLGVERTFFVPGNSTTRTMHNIKDPAWKW